MLRISTVIAMAKTPSLNDLRRCLLNGVRFQGVGVRLQGVGHGGESRVSRPRAIRDRRRVAEMFAHQQPGGAPVGEQVVGLVVGPAVRPG